MTENNRLLQPKGSFQWGRFILIAISFIYVIVLILAPAAAIIQGAFSDDLKAVWETFRNEKILETFRLSLLIALFVAVFHAVAGTAVAWVMARHSFKGWSFLNGIIDTPFAVSPVVVGYMLLLLFGRNGLLAPLLQVLDIKVAFAVPGLVLATIFVTLPIMIRELIPVIRNLDLSQEYAAATLGAGGWTTFWKVVFPAMKWGLLYGVSLTFARALGEFGAVLVIGGGIQGKTETATVFIFHALEERQYIEAYSTSILLGIISMIFVIGADLLKKDNQ